MGLHVYVLQSDSTGRWYTGQTADLPARVAQHNDPADRLTLHTKRHAGPWRLIHSERFETRAEAVRRERWLKTGAGRDWLKRHLAGEAHGC